MLPKTNVVTILYHYCRYLMRRYLERYRRRKKWMELSPKCLKPVAVRAMTPMNS